jgi:hypothetical protein
MILGIPNSSVNTGNPEFLEMNESLITDFSILQ